MSPGSHLPAHGAAPRRILMTLDAVGGVWRYAIDLCKALGAIDYVLVGLGPAPSQGQLREVARLPNAHLIWLDEPLDWMAAREEELEPLAGRLAHLAASHKADLLHLNLPSQACGLRMECPVLVVSHSCVVTWWQAVKDSRLPEQWRWQEKRNRNGFEAADMVLAPSRSHADLLTRCYGPIERLRVVANGTGAAPGGASEKHPFVFAAGRWWDEGKNGIALDEAARTCAWPVVMAGACRNGQAQAVELSHARHVGELSYQETQDMIGRAAIVASPSLYEPFGLVALEAARAGAALVLADIATYRELWDGAALFADPRDASGFARAIDEFASRPELRAEFGLRAARRAERFSLQAQADAICDAYRAAGRTRATQSATAA
jgi:glycosyltransferase involved in cell wall biosynthesis